MFRSNSTWKKKKLPRKNEIGIDYLIILYLIKN